MLPRELSLTVQDTDDDYIVLSLLVSDGIFAGTIDVYESPVFFPTLADGLRDFPASPSDSREFEIGSFGPRTAGGGARLVFSQASLRGGIQLTAELEEAYPQTGSPRTAVIVLTCEIAALDRFVTQLRTASVVSGTRVVLANAG